LTRSDFTAGAEAQHRLRRVLAAFRSIAAFMARDDASPASLRLAGRIGAISRVALASADGGIDLEALVLDELLACATPRARYRVEGSDIRLSGKAAQLMGLALHELAANSLQYGALSQTAADLSIEWRLSEEKLVLCWTESKVRMAMGKRTAGFGSELVQRRFASELKGSGEMVFSIDGMRCTIAVPLSEALHQNE
jgi:two-component system CheB/CheR fusion protein